MLIREDKEAHIWSYTHKWEHGWINQLFTVVCQHVIKGKRTLNSPAMNYYKAHVELFSVFDPLK